MKQIILIFIFSSISIFSQEFVIDTSRGEVTLVVPEDQTIEEAYKEMASLYLEERFDLEESLHEIDILTDDIDNYIEEVNKLHNTIDDLQEDNSELQELYDTRIKEEAVKILFDVGAGFNWDNSYYISASFGLQFFDSWYAQINTSYPLRLGLTIGREF